MDRPASTSSLARAELVRLLARVGAGERTALKAVYERTSAKLYGICLRVLGSEAEAQDALQDTFVTVWRRAATFEAGRASPITWLALIAHSRAIDLKRRRGASAEPIEQAADIADEREGAEALAVRADEQGRLHGCLETLDDRARGAIRSAFLDGLSYPELAAREGVPLGTMKSWVRRGLIRLKGCMEQ
ncbi:sigma-70 family RNA polymerase sigma factor [Sphingomonas rosea]